MKSKSTILSIIIAMSMTLAFCQQLTPNNPVSVQTGNQYTNRRHFIGSSLFLLGNIDTGDPVYFGQLNYGYQLTPKSNLIVEAITWTYYEPLGTYGNSDEMYPGKVRACGVGLGYQRFLWKNSFTSLIATPFTQQYYDADNKKLQRGMQLYLQSIVGYRFEFCKKRLFAEPAIAFKYWPVDTNIPDSFADINEGTPDYKFEPSANFGWRF